MRIYLLRTVVPWCIAPSDDLCREASGGGGGKSKGLRQAESGMTWIPYRELGRWASVLHRRLRAGGRAGEERRSSVNWFARWELQAISFHSLGECEIYVSARCKPRWMLTSRLEDVMNENTTWGGLMVIFIVLLAVPCLRWLDCQYNIYST